MMDHYRWYWCVVLAFIGGLPAWAFSPQEALTYRSNETLAMQARVKAMQAVYEIARFGTTGTLSTSAQEKIKQSYSLSLSYNPEPLTILENKHTLDTGIRDFRKSLRQDISTALLAHAVLWEAQAGTIVAQQRETQAGLLAREAERKHALGAMSDADRELAQIDAADAALAVRRAQQTLDSVKRDARRLTFTDTAETTMLTFRLPKASVEGTPTFREANWNALLTQARERKTWRDLRPALVAEAIHLGTMQVTSSFSSRGSGSIQLGYPTLYDPTFLFYSAGWTYTLRAEIPLDPIGWMTTKTAHAESVLARTQLAAQRDQLAIQIPRAEQEAESARETLGLAQDRRRLQQRKLDIIQAKATAGAVSDLDVQTATIAVGDAETQVARAWKGYISAMTTYLDLIDGTWEVAP